MINLDDFAMIVQGMARAKVAYIELVKKGVTFDEARLLIVNQHKCTMLAATEQLLGYEAITGEYLKDSPTEDKR